MDAADRSCAMDRPEADISIVERIVRKTGNRKLAAVLALDLFLVGVDTVRHNTKKNYLFIKYIFNNTNPSVVGVRVCLWKTSVAISSTIYQLAKNPQKQEKLFQELQRLFPTTHEAEINQNVLEQIPYLRACVKETLRYVWLTGLNASVCNNTQMDVCKNP